MRITEKQLQMLMLTLVDSTRANIEGIFMLTHKCRLALYETIMSQQSDVIQEIKSDWEIYKD